MKIQKSMVMITLMALLLLPAYSLVASDTSGNTTLGGVNGYIAIPSAEPVFSGENATVTTGYSAIFNTTSFAHIPFLQIGFAQNVEISVAADIGADTDILLNTKWRFSHSGDTSFAVGVIGQAVDVATNVSFAGQLYVVSTFTGSFIDLPAKTTILLGYTFDNTMNSDIDFGMGIEAPFFRDVFKDKVKFLIDFGNVSYSTSPSGGNAASRGLVNVGLRLLPIEVLKAVYFSLDIRAMDLLDASGRALSAGVSISFRP